MFKRDVRLAENTLNKQDEIISQMKVSLSWLLCQSIAKGVRLQDTNSRCNFHLEYDNYNVL